MLSSLFRSTRKSPVVPISEIHASNNQHKAFKRQTIRRNFQALSAQRANMDANRGDYSAWSHKDLIDRVTQLELALKSKNESTSLTPTPIQKPMPKPIPKPNPAPKKSWKKPRTVGVFDPSKYNTRLIALKLAYLGKNYNGFEHHVGHKTPLPTIEEELWKALNKSRLIFPTDTHSSNPGEINWEGCEYSKCGRTDKGVSAFGQVIGIRVRSNRPLPKQPVNGEPIDTSSLNNTAPRDGSFEIVASPTGGRHRARGVGEFHIDEESAETLNFDPILDEIQYPTVLNRLLPPDIRILAWCPSPPIDFSARFSCRERRYRYFFTQPCFMPTPSQLELPATAGAMKDGWLDIPAMRKAARLFEGYHDFRNFCKVDAGKQITNFERMIHFADIEEVEDTTASLGFINADEFLPGVEQEGVKLGGNSKMYTFTLHGSAFLWHQVRHMVAVLFLVAQGLEKPEIISTLLDVEKNPRRPVYEMAIDTPLVLWDCIFPADGKPHVDGLAWEYVGDGPALGDQKFGIPGLMDDLWRVWRERKIDEVLAGTLMSVAAAQGRNFNELEPRKRWGMPSQKVFDGDNGPRLQGTWKPVMKKTLMDTVDDINGKFAVKKGYESGEDMRSAGFWKMGRSELAKRGLAHPCDMVAEKKSLPVIRGEEAAIAQVDNLEEVSELLAK